MEKEQPIQLTVKVPPQIHGQLQRLSSKQHKSIAEVIRGMIQKGLNVESAKDDIGFIRQQLNEEIRHVMQPLIERVIKVNVKGGIASAASLFLLAEIMSSMVHESRRRDFDEAVATAKKRGAEYFRLRDYEIDQFLREDGRLSESLW